MNERTKYEIEISLIYILSYISGMTMLSLAYYAVGYEKFSNLTIPLFTLSLIIISLCKYRYNTLSHRKDVAGWKSYQSYRQPQLKLFTDDKYESLRRNS